MIVKKVVTFFTVLFLLSFQKVQQNAYVPDAITAMKIAEAIWLPIYGESIYKERPFHATLVGDSVWFVQGSKAKSGWDTVNGKAILTVISGGVLNAEIRKSDGKVIRAFHGK